MTACTNPTRHLLVVGAQCEGGAALEGLEDAARALHTALVDPALGGCDDRGEGERGSLLIGTGLGRDAVLGAVDGAVEAAGLRAGPLVLALLGHGETVDGDMPLHLVAAGRGDALLHQVNVPDLLGKVLQHPGVTELTVIVDTCFSGAAVPDRSALTAGTLAGDARLSLLFAATAKESAYEMRLSKELTRLIEHGLADAGDLLTVDDALVERLRERIEGQQPGRMVFDGAPSHGNPPWLARNRAAGRDRTLGPISNQALRDAVRRIDAEARPSTEEALAAWLRDRPDGDPGSGAALLRAQEVLAELETRRGALRVTGDAFGTDLTEERLRLAGMLAGLPLHLVRSEPAPTLQDLVEHAVHHGGDREGSHRALAHFVAALAHVTGHGDALPDGVLTWAQRLHLTSVVRTRLDEIAHQPGDEHAPRLVLVLADDGGEQVVRVDAWLLFGRATLGRERFACDGDGLPAALGKAVTWAAPWADIAGTPLRQIEVAAPTLVLLDSPPEAQLVRRQRLGIGYTVTSRWSGMLTPPYDLTVDDMLQVGRTLLESLGDATRLGPAWLHADDLRSLEHLQEMLAVQPCGAEVWAVSALPNGGWDHMAHELLSHTPALVWPRHPAGEEPAPEGGALELTDSVARHWRALPRRIAAAYREHLTPAGHVEDDGLAPLAAVRTVWHDEHWQAFCQRRARVVVRAPHETTSKERA
ncbi:vWA-MoxR associated conflict system protein [Streptomyces zhihengii]